MTRPRQIFPGEFYLLTRRCTQRQFLLRPDDVINNAIAYCLAVSAKRCNIIVLLAIVESNHHHTIIYDPDGRCPEFIQHFHKLVARCINTRRRRKENVWSSAEACVTRLVDHEAVLDKLVYAAANPVQDGLVERAVQWPGINGYRQLINGKAILATRPNFFFRRNGEMPEVATLEFTLPSELGNREDIIAELRQRVEAIERATKLKRAGARVLGTRMILKQPWQDSPPPNDEEDRNSIRPRFAGRRAALADALTGFSEFLRCYREARSLWLEGKSCVFPAGTYWMARFTPAANAVAPAN